MTEKRFTHTELHYMSFNEVLELLNRLNDENEQLKNKITETQNTIQKMIKNEKTHIGKNILKQAYEAIQ